MMRRHGLFLRAFCLAVGFSAVALGQWLVAQDTPLPQNTPVTQPSTDAQPEILQPATDGNSSANGNDNRSDPETPRVRTGPPSGSGGPSGPGGPGGLGGRRGGRRGPFGGNPNSLSAQLRNDEFRASLALTSEQEEQITTLQEEFRNEFRNRFRPGADGPPAGGPPPDMAAIAAEQDSKLLKVLSEPQRERWAVRQKELGATGEQGSPAGDTPKAGDTQKDSAAPTKPPISRPTEPQSPIDPTQKRLSFGPARETDFADGAKFSFNFRFAPWTDVLVAFAERAGLTLDYSEVPSGTFNYLDDRAYSPIEALDVLNGYLLPKGFVLVRRDRFLVVANIENGIPPNLIPDVLPEDLPSRGRNELVSVIIPLSGLDADRAAAEVKDLLGPQGRSSSLRNINALIVSDTAGNVSRVYKLLNGGEAYDNRELGFKSIPLQHITAAEAERTVRRLFGLTPTTAASLSPAAQLRNNDQNRGPNNGPGGPQQPPQPPPVDSSPKNKLQVTTDARTNRLLVTAPAALLKTVEEIVLSIDTNIDGQGRTIDRSGLQSVLKVYSVPSADILQVSRTVSAMHPGTVVGEDTRYGRIHIQATDSEHTEIERLIKQLGGEASSSVTVIYLQKLDPAQTTNSLLSLFGNDGQRSPTIEPDYAGKRIMVRGTPDQVAQVRALLLQLGEEGTNEVKTKSSGTVRTFNLGGRDAEEFLPLVEQVWSNTELEPIRIVVPARPNPVRERRVPGSKTQRPETQPPNPPASRRPAVDPESGDGKGAVNDRRLDPRGTQHFPAQAVFVKSASLSSQTQVAVNTQAKTANDGRKPDGFSNAEPESGAPSVGIAVSGDDLILTSEDEKSLDRLERLLTTLSQAIPAKPRWTVFYLRKADATDAAQMLERLFPTSSVTMAADNSGSMFGNITNTIGSVGRGMMRVSGLNSLSSAGQMVRIVTEPRLNALFVTGAPEKVREIEQMLELLDASDPPESLRDRLPRSIPVEFADVNDIYKIIDELYQDKQGKNQQPQNQQQNPFAMLMGGQAAAANKQRGPELTLGVDRRTNHLIVSASDGLFRQIEDLVISIDERARDARQTVRIVPLEKADPMILQESISSLIPRVSVSSTRAKNAAKAAETQAMPPAGQPGQPGGPNAGGPPAGDAESMRRMMEQGRGRGRGRGAAPPIPRGP